MPSLDSSNLPIMPEQVRCPTPSNYGIKTTNPIQSNSSIAGNVRTRNRWRNVPQQVSLSYRLNDVQAQIFEGFIRWEANNGASPFVQYLCMPGDKTPQPYIVRWTEIYDGATWVEDSLGLWDYTCTAITIRDERPSQEQYVSLKLLGGKSIEDALSDFEDINTHWNPYSEASG